MGSSSSATSWAECLLAAVGDHVPPTVLETESACVECLFSGREPGEEGSTRLPRDYDLVGLNPVSLVVI